MEPRPQQPRQPSGGQSQPQGQPSSGGSQPPSQPPPPPQGPENQGYPEGYDPTTVVAPPRADYDYSPLDLAPPGQRRRRQLIAGALGALSVVLVGALIVFGWMLVRDDPADDDPQDRVASVTQTPESNEAAGDGGNVAATPPATTEAPTEEAAAEPTPPEATEPPDEDAPASDVETDEAGLTAILPDSSTLPEGFDEGADASRSLEEVTNALGASRIAEQNLANWGWTANVERTFTNPAAEPGVTSSLIVSLHGFQDGPAAAEALPFFTDILINLGYYDVDPPPLGESQRMLRQDQEDGTVWVTLYVQEGPIMYRYIGIAPGGDPTQDVIDVATQMLGGD